MPTRAPAVPYAVVITRRASFKLHGQGQPRVTGLSKTLTNAGSGFRRAKGGREGENEGSQRQRVGASTITLPQKGFAAASSSAGTKTQINSEKWKDFKKSPRRLQTPLSS